MKNIFLAILLLTVINSYAQNDSAIKNLEVKLNAATDAAEKINIVQKLAEKYNLESPEKCQDILSKGIFIAEESRNRELMMKARRIAGQVFGQMNNLKEYSTKAVTYTQEALDMSKTIPGCYKEKVLCNMQMARLQRIQQHNGDAIKYNETALENALESKEDSLIVIAKIGYGNTQIAAGEKLAAFKTYISAETVAEQTTSASKEMLQTTVYSSMAYFYSSIEEYDRAIDYQYKSLNYAKAKQSHEEMFSIMNSIGFNFIAAKKYDAASKIFNELVQLADSLKMPDYAIQGKIGMINTLLSGPEAAKSITYLKEHPEIKALYNRIHLNYQLDFGMGQVYFITGQYDSAKYYFERSIPDYEKSVSLSSLPNIYLQYAKFLYKSGSNTKAIDYLAKAVAINDSLKNSLDNKDVYALLDSCYQKNGDYKNAYLYNGLFQKMKLQAEEKAKAKDILAVEIDAENKRKERIAKEEEEAMLKRHNWQYMGIVLSIFSLFVLLATLGLFNVPLKWIRALGFISFIFLFEFIILLADTWIHHATHGEPWKVLAIKVVLIAMLLPLHHYLEHAAIKFITERKHRHAGSSGPVATSH